MCGASIVHYCVLLCQIASFRLGFFLYLSSIKISIWHYKQPDWNFSTWVWISPRMIKYCWWSKSWATLLVLHLLARIYHKGCLCCWREDRCLLFTRRLSEGCTADYVQQVVDALLERGFFSKAQYEKNGILTSESIQDHYFEAVQQRKCVEVSTDYLLIEISKYKNLYVDGSNVGISTENVDMKTWSYKVKQSKKRKGLLFILFSRKEEDFCGERDFFFYSCRWKMQKCFRTSWSFAAVRDRR